MNIYVVDAGTYEYTEVFDSELGGPQVEDYAIGIVAANSRGQAKSVFLKSDRDYQRAFEFTSPMRVLKLGPADYDELESSEPHLLCESEIYNPYGNMWWDIAHEKLGK